MAGAIRTDLQPLIHDVVRVVGERWQDPDHGIWETRWTPQQFVFSKVMAWVAVDRAIAMARAFDLDADLSGWESLRDAIRRAVYERGRNHESGAFRRSFEEPEPDAALLRISAVGFAAPDAPESLATLRAVERVLARDELVRRHVSPDGPSDRGGAFVIASFWRVSALGSAGRRDEAARLFEKLLSRASDLGLFAEKLDMQTGSHLGNFPQAFSHVGLIDAALALER